MPVPTKPLKVTARLVSPLAGDPPMLDALLEWVMSFRMTSVMRTCSDDRHSVDLRPRGMPVSEAGKIPIPVWRKTICGLPIPLSSAPIFRADWDTQEHFNKALQFALCDLLEPTENRIIATTGGPFKSYRLPLRVRGVQSVSWFCLGRGRASGNGSAVACEVRKLLKHVTSIGKKTSIGYGRVAGWTVEQADDDYSWFAPSDTGTVLMRPLPWRDDMPADLVGFRRDFGSPCPPYWQREFYREIVTPC